ncbi:unnamed protein product [Ophioblennius macclurei]
MPDVAVRSESAWVCRAQGRHLNDVVHPVHAGVEEELGQADAEETNGGGAVLLEQAEEGAPCVLTLHCGPESSAAISRLLVTSEARTMEVYDQMGEYCGTVRGEKDDGVQPDSADRGPFFRKQLILEHPSSSCEVKLLSLAGRSSVVVCRVVVVLQPLRPPPARGPGIDMQQVQSLMEEMGTSLSPGAQNLMDMVQVQQKNQSGSLGGFLPLLMGGGAFSALARGAGNLPVDPTTQCGGSSESCSSSITSSPDQPMSDVSSTTGSSEAEGPAGHAQLTDMISQFLRGNGGAEILPMLQNVCGQVTQLRLDEAAAEREKTFRTGSWELDSAMERRLEEMERRLKEHLDRRLDALEQKLDKALLLVLNHGDGGVGGVGPACAGPSPGEIAGTTAAH